MDRYVFFLNYSGPLSIERCAFNLPSTPPLPFAVSTKIFSTGGREVSFALELYDIRVEGECAVRYAREER